MGALDMNAQSANQENGLLEFAKSDRGDLSDVEWANQFFLTQIYDERFNPDGLNIDTESNNCGPASLAMLMSQRGEFSSNFAPEVAIDHARAMMYMDYPDIDPATLSEEATLYMKDDLILVDDDTQPVFFEAMTDAPSVAQGLTSGGANPVFGSSWAELNKWLQASGAVIAHGYITESWRAQFSDLYGASNSGAVSHFITIFESTSPEQFIVCDPMHRGGAVLMTRSELGRFFRSPVNVFDSTIRIVAWGEKESEGHQPLESDE